MKQSKLKITIITVTFNSEKHLAQCIESVLSQTYPNIEYIIVDGNSKDSTIEIVKKYESRITKWISEPDSGMFDALNKGMKLATGDVIGVLHSDDVFASTDVIESVVKAFETEKVDTIYGDLKYVYAEDISKLYRIWKGKPFNRNLFKFGWMPAHPAFYFKRQLIEKYGNYETHFFSAADYELMARFLYKNKVSAYYLPKLCVLMRRGGLSNNNIFKRLRANRRDYLAMKANGIPLPFIVSILKPLSKLHQYYKK